MHVYCDLSPHFLSMQGARVIVGDLQVSDGEKVAKEIGENAVFVPMDVSLYMMIEYRLLTTLR